jgi:hypothetical protein
MLSDQLQTDLCDADATVLGRVGTVEAALDAFWSDEPVEGAIHDANLRGGMVFPATDLLMERGAPFAFLTG